MFKELFIEGALLLRSLPRCHRSTERQTHSCRWWNLYHESVDARFTLTTEQAFINKIIMFGGSRVAGRLVSPP